MVWRKKSGGDQSTAGPSPCYDDEDEKVPRGHVPMVTGCGERVLVPVRLLAAPCVAELLDMAAQQYGYGQPGMLLDMAAQQYGYGQPGISDGPSTACCRETAG